MKTTINLSTDIQAMAESLSFEETLAAIECATKVQKHLIKSIEAGNRYHRKNLEVVNAIIEAHRSQIFSGAKVNFA